MAEAAYTKGEVLRLTGTFRNAAGLAIDPGAVFCSTRNPLGVVTSLLVTRASQGVYYADVHFDVSGRWAVQFDSTGTGEASQEREYYVMPSVF